MPINVAIDDGLLAEALRAGGCRTRCETVNEALAEYLQRRKRRHFVGCSARSISGPTVTTTKRACGRGSAAPLGVAK